METMTPTPAGQVLLGGSIKDGSLLQEHLTTDTANPSVFGTFTEPNGTSVNTVTGGQSKITLKGLIILLEQSCCRVSRRVRSNSPTPSSSYMAERRDHNPHCSQ